MPRHAPPLRVSFHAYSRSTDAFVGIPKSRCLLYSASPFLSLSLSRTRASSLTVSASFQPLSLSTASSLASSNASASGSATTRNPTAIPRTSSGEFGGGNEFVFAFLFPPSPARLGLRLSPLISLSPPSYSQKQLQQHGAAEAARPRSHQGDQRLLEGSRDG